MKKFLGQREKRDDFCSHLFICLICVRKRVVREDTQIASHEIQLVMAVVVNATKNTISMEIHKTVSISSIGPASLYGFYCEYTDYGQ